jgi:hypothetical protein
VLAKPAITAPAARLRKPASRAQQAGEKACESHLPHGASVEAPCGDYFFGALKFGI